MTRRKSLDSSLHAQKQQQQSSSAANATAPATIAATGRRRSTLKKAPLRGILKSPMRDMTAPIHPTSFYGNSNDDADDDNTKDYGGSKTMNITNVERRLSRKSIGRRVSFAATARVRVIDRVDTPRSKQRAAMLVGNRRESFGSPQVSFTSDNSSFQSGVFSMPNLNTDGNDPDTNDDFNLHLSMTEDTTGQLSVASRTNSSISYEHTSAWQEEYEVQVNQLTSSSSASSSSPGSMLTTELDDDDDDDDDSEESDMSFASEMSMASPFTAVNQDSPLNNRRASMGVSSTMLRLQSMLSPNRSRNSPLAKSSPLRQSVLSDSPAHRRTNTPTSASIANDLLDDAINDDEEEEEDDDEDEEMTTMPLDEHSFGDMTMETTRCLGGIISQSQSQSTFDEDQTMELTRCVGDGIHEHAEAGSAPDSIQSFIAGEGEQPSEQNDAATAMDDEVTMEMTQCVGEGIKPHMPSINDVWMGAPSATATPDSTTMDLTRCVGDGIIGTSQNDEGGDEDDGQDDDEDMDLTEQYPSQVQQSAMMSNVEPSNDAELDGLWMHNEHMPSTPPPPSHAAIAAASTTPVTAPRPGTATQTPEKPAMPTKIEERDEKPSGEEQAASMAAPDAVHESPQPMTSSLMDTPRNRRIAAEIREALRMGTPGRLTPARPRKVELRSPRTLERRARTPGSAKLRSSIASRLSASYSLRSSFIAQSNANLSAMGLEQNDLNSLSMLQLEQSQTGTMDNVTQALNAVLNGDTADLFNITAPLLSNDTTTTLAQTDKADTTTTTRHTTHDLTKIAIRDFLSLAGINFMDNLTTTNRRLTLMPEVVNAKATPSDRVISLITVTPLAELYEFYCTEFQVFIENTKSSNVKIEAHLSANNPPIVKQYMSSSPEGRAALELNKSYAKAQTMHMLYQWRGQLLHPVASTLQGHLENLNYDERVLKEVDQQVRPMLPSIKERHKQVRDKLEKLKARKKELDQCDADQIAQLKEAIEEQNFRDNLTKIETEKQTLSTELEQAIAAAKATCSAARHATKQDLDDVQTHYELVSNAFGCQFIKMDANAMTISYQDRYQLQVHYRLQQITCTPNEQHLASMPWWDVLRPIMPNGVVSKFTTKTLKRTLQHALHSLAQLDAFLDDISTLHRRHQVEAIEVSPDASRCLISARTMDRTGKMHIGLQFSVTMPFESTGMPQWKVLADLCSVNPADIAQHIDAQVGASAMFRQLTGIMDAVRASVH
ncbi:Spc7 kinetochore protein-domain-containing protein [Syncephalis pseudoplumigaleata]|uniref:Spc7 kinetochore protein-domain-containing protein n=1 Tax=Syncephalis pseudoplumigaleata TaxID=1712513 RepID=A0A4P9Z2A8_9FUNG|nr:Spc7 kinetochore protein-domain-containing protein [Syncephalis pseudoplumigaleata]|eukprot:RKP25911.1 Spc7 kinetochore protein-domain-containing protein [Syncephalis pseudoplumigaleata]